MFATDTSIGFGISYAHWLWLAGVAILPIVLWRYAQSLSSSLPIRARYALLACRGMQLLGLWLLVTRLGVWQSEPLARPLAVVMDDSSSMQWRDATLEGDDPRTRPSASRYEVLQGYLQASPWADVAFAWDSLEVQVRSVSSGEPSSRQAKVSDLARLAAERSPRGVRSPLGDAIQAAIDESERHLPAAVLVLTDGEVNGGRSLESALRAAKRLGIPVFIRLFGRDATLVDLALRDVRHAANAFPGETIPLDVTFDATVEENEKLRVTVQARAPDGSVLAERTLEGIPRGLNRTSLPLRVPEAAAGELAFEVRLTTDPPEREATNNVQRCALPIRAKPIRLLLVDSVPRYEFRALQDLLTRRVGTDAAGGPNRFEPRFVLLEADERISQVDPHWSAAPPPWQSLPDMFDLVVMGDVDWGALSSAWLDTLRLSVSRDGVGLVWLPGPRFGLPSAEIEPLRPLLPYSVLPAGRVGPDDPPTRMGITPTPLGRDLGLVHSLPPVEGWFHLRRWKPLVQVLAVTDGGAAGTGTDFANEPVRERVSARDAGVSENLPALTLHFAGLGKVLFQCSDQTWRSRRESPEAFDRYWLGLLRYAEGNRELASQTRLRLDREAYFVGDTIRLRAALARSSPGPGRGDVGREAGGDASGVAVPRVQIARVSESDRESVELTADRLLNDPWVGETRLWEPGSYLAELIELGSVVASVTFEVHERPTEPLGQPFATGILAEAAGSAVGAPYLGDQRSALWRDLAVALTKNRQSRTFTPLGDRMLLPVGLLALVVCEWGIRARFCEP